MEIVASPTYAYLHSTQINSIPNARPLNSNVSGTESTAPLASHKSVQDDPNYELSPMMKAIMIAMYTIIAILAMFGNVGVCYIVKYILSRGTTQPVQTINKELARIRGHKDHAPAIHAHYNNTIKRYSPTTLSVTNLFIMHLAIADILMALLCIPFSFVADQILGYWPFGPIMCPVVSYAQAISVMISAYVMVVISVDRYAVVMFPLRPKMTSSHARIALTGVYAWAFAIPLPIAILSHVEQEAKPEMVQELTGFDMGNKTTHGYHLPNGVGSNSVFERVRCVEDWPKGTNRQAYSISLLLIQYVIPLIILTFTYVSIGWRMWGSRTPGEAQACRDAKMAKSKKKLIKMMITVVIIFGLCWLPLNTLIVISDYNPKIFYYEKIHYIWFFCHWLAMSHSCCNPFIYCWMNSRFRRGFRHIYYTLTCRSTLTNSTFANRLRFGNTLTSTFRESTLPKRKSPSKKATWNTSNGLRSDQKNEARYDHVALHDFNSTDLDAHLQNNGS